MSHAGSWHEFPDRRGRGRRSAWLAPASKALDHDHASAAARTRRTGVIGKIQFGLLDHGCFQQPAGLGEVVLAGRAGEQAIVADAMEPARQNVEQEAADELLGGERHDLLPFGIVAAVVLVTEGDASLVEGDEAPVRNGDAVGIARQVSEHRLRSGKGGLGIDHPAGLPGRGEMREEGAAVSERRKRSEEGEPPGVVQLEQPGQEQAAEQLAQHPHRQEEGGTRGYPSALRPARCRRPGRSCGRADDRSSQNPRYGARR